VKIRLREKKTGKRDLVTNQCCLFVTIVTSNRSYHFCELQFVCVTLLNRVIYLVCVLHRYTSYLRRVGCTFICRICRPAAHRAKDDNNIVSDRWPIQRPSGGLSHAIDSNSPK
jgi:hypothetical protein